MISMPNYYKILGLEPSVDDSQAINNAYQAKVVALTAIDAYSCKAVTLVETKWQITLPLLIQWKNLSQDAKEWREFLHEYKNDSSAIKLVSDEVKKRICELNTDVSDEALLTTIYKTFTELEQELEKKLRELTQLRTAHSVLFYPTQRLPYQQYCLFFKTVHDSLPETMLPELTQLIVSYTL